MKIGDRARLMIARGVNPHAGADLSGSRVSIYNRHIGVPVPIFIASCIVLFAMGAFVPDNVKSAMGLRASLTPIDERNAALLAESRIDANHPLPNDLATRLALTVNEVHTMTELLKSDAVQDATLSATIDARTELSVVSPSRLKNLRDFLMFLDEQPRANWPEIMVEIRFQQSITSRARAILAALANANNVYVQQLGLTLNRIMALPFEKRGVLYRSGFPTVPTDPARQALYAGLGTLSDVQAAFLYTYMHSADLQVALSRTSELFRSPNGHVARKLLGLFAEGRHIVVEDGGGVSPNCDVALPHSCERIP